MNETALEKARQKYKDAYNSTSPGDLLEILGEVRSFVARHTEPWYYAGHEMLGRLDAVIANEELKNA